MRGPPSPPARASRPAVDHFGGGGEAGRAVQRPARPHRRDSERRQDDEKAESGGGERADELLAQCRIVAVERPSSEQCSTKCAWRGSALLSSRKSAAAP